MLRRLLLVGAAVTLLAPAGVFAAKPTYSCPPGFNLGAQSLDDWLALPRTQAAISDGLTTVEDVTAWFVGFDSNGDGMVCAQLSHGFELSSPNAYFYNAAEDNASVPG